MSQAIYSRELESQKVEELHHACNLFWAFSREQFEEGKKNNPLTPGDVYVSIGAGGYMPKSKVDTFIKGMKEITKWAKESKKNDREVILYELNNHECFYRGDIEDALPRLAELGYTREQVQKVFKSAKKLRRY